MSASTFIRRIRSVPWVGIRPVLFLLAFGAWLGLARTTVAQSDAASADPFESAVAAEPVKDAAPTAEPKVIQPAESIAAQSAFFDPFEMSTPIDTAAYFPESTGIAPQHELVFLQTPSSESPAPSATPVPSAPAVPDGENDTKKPASTDPCAAMVDKPMCVLGINILLPSGLLPKDHAALCWAERNTMDASYLLSRCWPVLPYFWDAPCLCYRPLYFEETNLERHGYGCCKCIQPVVSAAHFFGTVPALPYCMADHCPCECEYTLGHYRPGSCPPWRCNWPSCKPIAAAAEAGVMTGLIFAIP